MGRTAHSYDAEVVGAIAGLRAVCSHIMAYFARNFVVYLGYEEVAIRFQTGQSALSSSTQFLDFQKLYQSWTQIEWATGIENGTVQVRWITGHTGIIGNERADVLTKQVYGMVTANMTIILVWARIKLEENHRVGLTKCWNSHPLSRCRDLGIEMAHRTPPSHPGELFSLLRRSIGILLASQSELGYFAAYHHRFKHTETELYCSCEQEKYPNIRSLQTH